MTDHQFDPGGVGHPDEARRHIDSEDVAVAMLAAAEAVIAHLWDIAARFETDQCNAIRDPIHRLNTLTLPAIQGLCPKVSERQPVPPPGAVPPTPRCPHCQGTNITEVYRPEVYEFSHICRDCDKGFETRFVVPGAVPAAPPKPCRVCGGYGFVAQKRFLDDGYGEVDSCPACDERDKAAAVPAAQDAIDLIREIYNEHRSVDGYDSDQQGSDFDSSGPVGPFRDVPCDWCVKAKQVLASHPSRQERK